MKKAFDINGNEISVPDDTIVRTRNGKHYVLTDAEKAEYEEKNKKAAEKFELYLKHEKYKDDRKEAYKSTEEQMDMLYWDMVNGTTTFVDHRTDVKTRIPKPKGLESEE